MEVKRNLAFGIIALSALVVIALIAWQFLKFPKLPEEVIVKPKEKIPPAKILYPIVATGKQTYEIITDKPRDPQIIEVEVDPIDVEVGKTQIVTVKVKTKAKEIVGTDSVSGKAITDDKKTEFSLKLKKAEGKEELITTWQGEWVREGGTEKNYQLMILANFAYGQDKITLTFK